MLGNRFQFLPEPSAFWCGHHTWNTPPSGPSHSWQRLQPVAIVYFSWQSPSHESALWNTTVQTKAGVSFEFSRRRRPSAETRGYVTSICLTVTIVSVSSTWYSDCS